MNKLVNPPREPMKRARNAKLSSAMWAGFGVLCLVAFAETAGAKPMTCAARQVNCNERCILRNNETKDVNSCVQRTCAHQYNNCMNDSSGGGGRGDTSAGGGRGGAGGGGGVSTSGGQKTAGGAVVRDHRGKR